MPLVLASALTDPGEDPGASAPGVAHRWQPPAEPWIVAGAPRSARNVGFSSDAAAIRVLVPVMLLARMAGGAR
jgi:hypothetical protein